MSTNRDDLIERLCLGLEALDQMKKAEPLIRNCLAAAQSIAQEVAEERDRLRDENQRMRSAGTICANILFNLKKRDSMDPYDKLLCKNAQLEWDRVALPHRTEGET